MDFDDMDERIEAAPKPSKFAPKSSKFQPKQRPKPQPISSAAVVAALPKLEPVGDDHCTVTVKTEMDSETATKTNSEPSISSGDQNGNSAGTAKLEDEFMVDVGETVAQAMEEDEEEDSVVCEIDVYFNRPPPDDVTQLYVLQYPLRPSWRPYDLDKRCSEVRVRPNSSDLQIELSIDLDSGNFRPEAACAMGYRKQILSSGSKPRQKAGYAIGVLVGKELHLNPVHAVRQLRPFMDHIDRGDSQKESVPEVSAKAGGSSGSTSGKQNKTKDLKDDELWVPLRYHGSSSALSVKYLQKMVAGATSPLPFSMKPHDYLNFLCPRAAINKNKPSGPSKKSLLSLSLEERLRMCLIQGPPIQKFNILKHFAADDPIEDVFLVLQELAVLVQGHWVPKTPIRHPDADGSFSLARDGALLLLWRNPIIKNSELDNMKHKVRELMKKRILPELAVERKKCEDWKFREPVDSSFLKLYPDIVSKQNQKWEDNEKLIQAAVFGEKNGPNHKSSMKLDKSSRSLDKSVVKAANGARSVRRVMSDQTREALPKVLKKLFQTQKIWSFQKICLGLRDMAVSMSSLPKEADAKVAVSAALGVEAPEELLEVVSEVAVNIHGLFVLKSSSEHPEYDPLRNVVIDLFIGSGPNAKVKRSEIVEAAKIKLQREPTNDEFRKVMSEFCVSNGSAWVLKSVDGPPNNAKAVYE